MTTQEVLDAIAREQSRLFAAIDALGDRASTVAVTEEGWTAKDVLAHLIHYAGQLAFGLGAQLQPPAYVIGVTGRPTGEEWNTLAVAHCRDTPLDEVRAEFARILDALTSRVRLRTDEQMLATDAMPWAGGRPLWQLIAGDTFLHFPEHAEAIERVAS